MDNLKLFISSEMAIIQVLFSLWAAILIYKTFNVIKRNRNQYRFMQKTPPLSRSSKPGDYVRFDGLIALPDTKTPFTKKPCSYWAAMVRAEFETKKKSPSKGMKTHRPVIHTSSLEHIPFIVNDKQHTVLVNFSNTSNRMLNLKKKTTIQTTAPKSLKDLAKQKYKKYRIQEYWYPVNAMLMVFGTVQAVNKNCIVLSDSKDKYHFPLIFYGSLLMLGHIFKSSSKLASWNSFFILACVASLWTWIPGSLSFLQALISAVIVFALATLLFVLAINSFKLS